MSSALTTCTLLRARSNPRLTAFRSAMSRLQTNERPRVLPQYLNRYARFAAPGTFSRHKIHPDHRTEASATILAREDVRLVAGTSKRIHVNAGG